MSTDAFAPRAVAGVLACNSSGDLLLVRRSDEGTWGLPGGVIEPGETWQGAAERECLEETGWTVRVTGLFGIYSDPQTQRHTYPSGQQVQFLGVVFTAGLLALGPSRDAEASDVRFFATRDLPEHVFAPDRPVLADYTARRATPVNS